MFFDADQQQDYSYQPVPPGRYRLFVANAELKENKSQTGQIIKIEMNFVDDMYQGRKLFENINFTHENVQAENIGRSQFKNLCEAAGLKQIQTGPEQLNGYVVKADVIVKPDRLTGEMRNVISKYHPDIDDMPQQQRPQHSVPPQHQRLPQQNPQNQRAPQGQPRQPQQQRPPQPPQNQGGQFDNDMPWPEF